ncbi:4-hydroxyphenylacetate 3-monooxygenase, reductase component [Andreprevotia chitinilytica]|uniref:4-hydroxyphenylacetate 3-monooxygenase, reductase component n=1 Tax=Andreprevotia chitinilytica TaxID=396808 RepID=UPI000555C344|nr:4-hydroxyphenylacetate 3-monooxygenase, reductase component [Andreprevotia chitinilytica]
MTIQDPMKQTFRNAMARFSAAVSVLTTQGEAGRCGITATAVCSVTDSPPTVLACINRNSAMNPVFKANGRMCINVLNGEQEIVARHFAGMTDIDMDARFAHEAWREGRDGLPVLDGCLASMEGRIEQVTEVGTHSIYLVVLDEITVTECGDGLVYFERAFHRLASKAEVLRAA